MGVFHCPFGAAFQDDDGCVDCGLCYAKTKEEMVAASRRIRELIQSQTDNNKPTQKIAIAGKGGVGKSTVVTLMANALKDDGYTVLIVDTDESNPGLYRLLGFAEPPRSLVVEPDRLPGKEAAADSGWPAKVQYSIQEIPAPFVLEDDRLRFLMMGKITDPFQGCACSMVDVIRDLVANLVLRDESKEAVLVDMEAGVESFGRGVERSVDTVLIVVEPSYESMALAEKAKYMADGIGLKRVRAILNKMPSDQIAAKVTEELNRKGIEPLGSLFFDPEISDSGLEGTALRASRAREDIKQIVRRLMANSE
jgi:CO dehydrogenase maturation factor